MSWNRDDVKQMLKIISNSHCYVWYVVVVKELRPRIKLPYLGLTVILFDI